jgi:hypothetical protein
MPPARQPSGSRPSDERLRLAWVEIGTAIIVGLVAWALNEFVFTHPGPSAVVRWALIPMFLVALWHSGWSAARFILVLGIALDARPRGVHLIPILERGDYAYYSPNATAVAGITISLTTLFMILPVLRSIDLRTGRIWRTGSFTGWTPLILIAWGAGVGLAHSIGVNEFEARRFLTDLKYPLFLLTGWVALQGRPKPSGSDVARFLVWLGLVVATTTVANGLTDLTLGRFLLKYNTSVLFSIGALTILAFTGDFRSTTNQLAAVLIAVSAFPITRGEQLIFGLNGAMIAVFLVRNLSPGRGAVRRAGTAVAGVVAIALVVSFAARQSEESAEFVKRKFELFSSLGQSLDKSMFVRLAEVEATIGEGEIRDVPNLLVGRGFGGFIRLGPAFRDLTLDRADYSAEELSTGRAYQPHLFVTYWMLKFGLFGTVSLIILYAHPLVRGGRTARLTYLAMLLPLLWQGYWVPVFAFLTGGLIQSAVGNANQNGSGL